MAIRDFIGERRSLDIGGRRFVVRRPSITTVVLVLELYRTEIGLCLDASQDCPELWGEDPLRNVLRVLLTDGDPRLEEILPTFVSGPDDPSSWPARELIIASLAASDLDRIVEALNLGSEPSEEEAGPFSLEHNVISLAERFHCSPFDVMGWPFESYLSICDALVELSEWHEQQREDEGDATPAAGDRPGVNVRTVRGSIFDFLDNPPDGFFGKPVH